MASLSSSERDVLLRIAKVATPAGAHVPSPSMDTVAAVERLLGEYGSTGLTGYRGLVHALDLAGLPFGGRLSELSDEARETALMKLSKNDKTAWFVRAVTAPLKVVQSQANGLADAIGAHDGRQLPVAREERRFEARIQSARDLTEDETLEVDCVVVGTGAGGPPVAKALASRGHAVVMLETGGYFTREDFRGRPLDLQRKLYWNGGITAAFGNTLIPVPMGRTVGGSTTINSGTCYRTPESTQRRWAVELGLHELGPGSLDPYFEKVEAALEISPARKETLGGCARVIARGCDALGWKHAPLARNAPGCDGQAVCCFGCPTDAKRSTNVSYVPAALLAGAMLYTHARVREVIVEGGRAVGVRATARAADGSIRRLTVRARAVVLGCGTVHSAGLLLAQGIANASDQVGKNLTLHPATYAWADFGERIDGFNEIPQGYAVEEFADQGIRMEGVFVPLSLAAGTMGQVGRTWTHLVERLHELACFGFMIAETSRGRVVLGPGRKPQMTYVMNDHDVRKVVQGFGLLARIYFAAGARAVYPGLQIFDELKSIEDVERLEREGPERVRAHHIDLSAYHPLGTCRMGSDPRRSVIGPTHESWDVPGLFICDGSAVPGPLGANPQVTIMALSERAAQFVEHRIENTVKKAPPKVEGPQVEFAETMAGRCTLEPSEGGGDIEVSFTVRAMGAASIVAAFRERGGTLALDGTISMPGAGVDRPCRGQLVMRPLKRRTTLVYDIDFEDEAGRPWTLHGEKHTSLSSPLRGMTTLFTEVRREEALVAKGILRFDLATLSPWLRSFKLLRAS